MKNSTLRESILEGHPVPENVAEVYTKRLDEFIKDISSEPKKLGMWKLTEFLKSPEKIS